MIGREHNTLYCTLTRVQVYGKGMHQILKENLKPITEDFAGFKEGQAIDKTQQRTARLVSQ